MTDRFPRPSGGDSGGPDRTPMERLLREAMNARAAQITPHSLRPAGPPSSRVRRLKPVYLTAVPLLGLAAAMAFGVLGFRGDTVADRNETPPPAATTSATPSPTPADTPTATATAVPSATTSPSATADPDEDEAGTPAGAPGTPSAPAGSTAPQSAATPYTFRGVKFRIPAGWRLAPQDTANTLCVLAPGAPQSATAGHCAPYGAELVVYNTADEAEHAQWPTPSALESDSGWTTQPYCPVWGNPHVPAAGEVVKNTAAPVRTRDIVAGRAVRKTQWLAACGQDAFTAQLWGLTSDQVYLSAVGLKPEHQAALVSILDTMDLGGRQAPAPAGVLTDVAVTVDGLTTGQQVPSDGSPVAFSVTFKNTGRTGYADVQPQVVAEAYGGSQPAVHGTMERQDGATWTTLDIAPPSVGKPARGPGFALAPGQSVTVKYRMKLTGQDGAGVMPVTADALVIPDEGVPTVLGTRTVPVRVVK
ncbi:hypothetical protein [Kitasatospora sp. NPDC047058]|uniref:hypothetical protein n=1 Tax=Kitasatospora sp. NPDC047058 TaxID=3155620 RepID=UPI0033EF9E11